MTGRDPDRPSTRSGTPLIDMLRAVASAFGPVSPGAVDVELDDHARRLFGWAGASADETLLRVAAVLGRELGFRADDGRPGALLLDRVLDGRRAHPAVLAAVGADVARRAGLDAGVYTAEGRWYLGMERDGRAVLLDARLDGGAASPPARARRPGAHEVVLVLLAVLAGRFVRAGATGDAARALQLRHALLTMSGAEPTPDGGAAPDRAGP